MDMEEEFVRMTDKICKPTEKEILGFIGEQAENAWQELRRFIEDNYEIEPETIFYGAKYGWTVRYRKSGKTLCSLFPEKGGFTVLITLGNKESEEAYTIKSKLSSQMNKLLTNTKQLHDGRWLWIRTTTKEQIRDVKELLQIKRRPKRAKPDCS